MTQLGINSSQLFAPDHKAFAPRVGFAYDVFGNGKTVVRAGASVISELVTLRTFLDNNNNISNLPTGFVIGCGGPLIAPVGKNNVPAGQTSNCNGTLLTAGGTITTAVSTFSAGNNDLGIPGVAPTAVNWDGPAQGTAASILPVGLTVPGNCNSNIFTAAPGVSGAQPGIPGGACNIEFANPNFKTPYVEGWNASIQQAIRNNMVLTVAYVGNHGVKLIGQTNINQAYPNVPGIGWNAVETSGANAGLTLGQICNNTALVNNGQPQSGPNSIDSFCVPGSLDNTKNNFVANIPIYGNVTAKNLYTDSVLNARPFNSAFPYLNNIVMITNRDTSNYDALQTTLNVRNYHGLSLQAGYTWSHALGIGSTNIAGASAGNAYNNSYNYGPEPSDVRHHFTLAPSYLIPGAKGFHGLLSGWRLNSTFLYQTGQAITPFGTGTDTTGVGGSRWDITGGGTGFVPALTGQLGTALGTQIYPQFYPGGYSPIGTINPRTGQAWVASDLAINNPTCVADAASKATLLAFGCWIQGGSVGTPPALNTFGDSAPGMARGPSFWELDSNITKTQKITERFSTEFRAEFYNIFNHPNFSPDAIGATCALGNCTAGQLTTIPPVASGNVLIGNGGPRRIALGVKIIF